MIKSLESILKNIFKKLGLNVSRIPKDTSDDIISSNIYGFNILINGKHQLPRYLEIFPDYGLNLKRLALYIATKKYKELILIDIGANIGDSVALIKSAVDIPIVCIEGNSFYFRLLKENVKQFENISTYQFFLGEKDLSINLSENIENGTLSLSKIPSQTENNVNLIKLDSFMNLNPEYKKSKLMKIDTDGYDTKIIRGGLNYIKETKPILFFEYDRVFLDKNNENGVETLELLESIGYKKIIFYDNYGRFILSTDISNKLQILQLDNYIASSKGGFEYYDLCLFHDEDEDIAINFINSEMNEINKV